MGVYKIVLKGHLDRKKNMASTEGNVTASRTKRSLSRFSYLTILVSIPFSNILHIPLIDINLLQFFIAFFGQKEKKC